MAETSWYQSYKDNFVSPIPFVGNTWTNIGKSFGKLEDYTIHWSIADKNITSAYEGIDNLQTYLSAYQQEKTDIFSSVKGPIMDTTRKFEEDLSGVVKILDRLAGTNNDPTVADQMVSAVQNVCLALSTCIAPVVAIGFPELPLIGNLGEYLQMLIQKNKILSQLPPEIKDTIQKKVKEKQKNPSWPQEMIAEVKNSSTGSLITQGFIDIMKILANLPFLPITILFSIVSVLIDAVTQLFKVTGLGTFNIDSMIKSGPKLDFNINIQDPNFDFDPPGNIIEALGKCIPLILQSITNLPQMIINSVIENLYLMFGGVKSLFSVYAFGNQDAMISAIQDTILSNQLYIENTNLSGQIRQNNKRLDEIKKGYGIDENTEDNAQGIGEHESESGETIRGSVVPGFTAISQKLAEEQITEFEDNQEVIDLKTANEKFEQKIRSNQQEMDKLTHYYTP